MTNTMDVHGWKATEYISGKMRVWSSTQDVWTWECMKCPVHHSGCTATSEDAMKLADSHRRELHGRKIA